MVLHAWLRAIAAEISTALRAQEGLWLWHKYNYYMYHTKNGDIPRYDSQFWLSTVHHGLLKIRSIGMPDWTWLLVAHWTALTVRINGILDSCYGVYKHNITGLCVLSLALFCDALGETWDRWDSAICIANFAMHVPCSVSISAGKRLKSTTSSWPSPLLYLVCGNRVRQQYTIVQRFHWLIMLSEHMDNTLRRSEITKSVPDEMPKTYSRHALMWL